MNSSIIPPRPTREGIGYFGLFFVTPIPKVLTSNGLTIFRKRRLPQSNQHLRERYCRTRGGVLPGKNAYKRYDALNSGTAEKAGIWEDDPEEYVAYYWECSCVEGAWPRLVRCSGSVERYNYLRQAEICRYGRVFNGEEDLSGCGCSEEEIDDGLDSEGSGEVGQDVDSGGV